MIPATPSTPAQHGRYERVLQAAAAILTLGGEETLQMKDLSQRADVSLATLYRYFPSKDHVLLAISYSRYENALRRVAGEVPRGATVQERVTNHQLREFRAEQRDQQLTAALTRVLTDIRPDYRQISHQIHELHMKVLQQVATPGRTMNGEQYRRLEIVNDVFGAATRRWLAGVSSAAEARFEIRMGGHLLNVPDLFPDEQMLGDLLVRNLRSAARKS
jgi:TetR/AcrR family transcriptional regulator, cholesterol catabolism regulator